eukprot:613603-Karenia_brevis.AAC.1
MGPTWSKIAILSLRDGGGSVTSSAGQGEQGHRGLPSDMIYSLYSLFFGQGALNAEASRRIQ